MIKKFLVTALAALCLGYAVLHKPTFNYAQSITNVAGLNNVGYAPFNLTSPAFNCDGFLEASKDLSELHVAFLYNTFGNDFSCLKILLNDPRLKTLEINLINEPGHRNNRLGSYEFLKSVGSIKNYDHLLKTRNGKLKRKYVKYTTPIVQLLNTHIQPSTTLFINPGLESNVTDSAGRVLVSWTREIFPSARIVWNPLRPTPRRRQNTNADSLEGHGLSPNLDVPCIFNLDGLDVSYPTRPALGELQHTNGQSKNWVQSGTPLFQLLETYANKCEVVFVWTAESNGLDYRKTKFVDPRKRNNNISTSMYSIIMRDIEIVHRRGKIYPTSYNYSLEDNTVVSTCDIIQDSFADTIKSGNVLKQSEFRDRGGVVLLPNKFLSTEKLYLINKNKVVDVYRNSGRYHDGRAMFRSNKTPTKYPFKTYLVFSHNANKICYKIDNPRVRLD